MAREFALSVVADIQQFQRELATLPGWTEKQAAAAARKLGNEMIRAQRDAAKEAKKAATDAAGGWKDAFAGVTLAITPSDIVGAARAVASLTQQTADLRNELVDASTRTGISARTLGGLRQAARGAGVEFSELSSALNGFPKRIGDVARGSGEARIAFDRLGIEVTDATGNLRNADDLFREIAQKLPGLESSTERAALATALWGESGGKVLQSGILEHLEAFSDLAEEFGTGTGPRAAEAAADWQRSMADVRLVMEGAVADISDLVDLGPNLDNFTLGFVYLRQVVKNAAADMATAVKFLTTGLQAWPAVLSGNEERLGELRAEFLAYQEAAAASKEDASDVARRFYELRTETRAAAAAQREAQAVTGEQAKIQREAADAARREAEAQREAAEAYRERAGVSRDFVGHLQFIAKIANEASVVELSAQEKLVESYEKRVAQVERARDAAVRLAQTPYEIQMAEEQATSAILALREELVSKTEELQAAELESEMEAIDVRLDANKEAIDQIHAWEQMTHDQRVSAVGEYIGLVSGMADQVVGIFSDAFSTITTNQLMALDEQQKDVEEHIAQLKARREGASKEEISRINQQLSEERKAMRQIQAQRERLAKRQFRAEKAARIASTIISGAQLGVQLALAPPAGLGVPAGPLVAAGITAAQLGIITAQKAPKFHRGGIIGMSSRVAPDEVPMLGQIGEGIANRRAMSTPGFRESLDRANAGLPTLPALRVIARMPTRDIELEIIDIAEDAGFERRRPGRAMGMR